MDLLRVKSDVLSGAVVAVALVPEAIAFSFIAGVSPLIGLYGAFILGLITSLFGGKPAMVSGATGAIAIIFASMGITLHAKYPNMSHAMFSKMLLEYIIATSLFAGGIQIIVGLLKLGKFIRLVPQPAIFGFVNGLAVVIAMSQIKFLTGQNYIMYLLVISTMLIIYLFKKLTTVVPSTLVAIVVMTLVVNYFGIKTALIGDLADIKGVLPTFSLPYIDGFSMLKFIAPYALVVAFAGLIESLLTLAILDEKSGTRGSGNKECVAQGAGNIVSSLFGGMAGCTMIGQSIINFTSGGRTRLSTTISSLLLISFVVIFSSQIALIPVSVLVGIMFVVSISTFEWSSFSRLNKMRKSDALIMIFVAVVTIFFNLAVAVVLGAIMAVFVFAYEHSKISFTIKEDKGSKVYKLSGPLFFGSVSSFREIFDVKNDPKEVVIDFRDSRVCDSSGVIEIDMITKKYVSNGKKILLRHLSEDCKATLKQAGKYCLHEEDDPTYKVAKDY